MISSWNRNRSAFSSGYRTGSVSSVLVSSSFDFVNVYAFYSGDLYSLLVLLSLFRTNICNGSWFARNWRSILNSVARLFSLNRDKCPNQISLHVQTHFCFLFFLHLALLCMWLEVWFNQLDYVKTVFHSY